jgi:hypothetical protein
MQVEVIDLEDGRCSQKIVDASVEKSKYPGMVFIRGNLYKLVWKERPLPPARCGWLWRKQVERYKNWEFVGIVHMHMNTQEIRIVELYGHTEC